MSLPSTRRARRRPAPPEALPTRDPLSWIVALLAVLLPCVAVSPDSPRWHGGKGLAVECGAALLLAVLLGRPASARALRGFGSFLWRGPQPFLLLLALWATLSLAWSSSLAFSALGLGQIWGGLLIYGVVASQARSEGRALLLLDALALTTAVVSVSGLVDVGGGALVARGVFHDHQLFGAFVMLLLPVLLAASIAAPTPHRWAAQGAAILCFAALVVSQTRSAWIGETAALATFAALSLWSTALRPKSPRTDGERRRRRTQLVPYILLGVVAVAGFVALAPQRDAVALRLRSLTTTVAQGREASLEWRLGVWRGARAMIGERLLLGWGVGCYPSQQWSFTGVGEPPAAVLADGPTVSDQAHDSYLQMAANLGIPGVLLWLCALAAAIGTSLRALPRLSAGGPRAWAVIGGVSALAGQATDALANPGWQFGEVALYFWIVLGLTMAAAGGAEGTAAGEEAHAVALPWRLLQGAAAATVGGWLAAQAVAGARLLPAPHL